MKQFSLLTSVLALILVSYWLPGYLQPEPCIHSKIVKNIFTSKESGCNENLKIYILSNYPALKSDDTLFIVLEGFLSKQLDQNYSFNLDSIGGRIAAKIYKEYQSLSPSMKQDLLFKISTHLGLKKVISDLLIKNYKSLII